MTVRSLLSFVLIAFFGLSAAAHESAPAFIDITHKNGHLRGATLSVNLEEVAEVLEAATAELPPDASGVLDVFTPQGKASLSITPTDDPVDALNLTKFIIGFGDAPLAEVTEIKIRPRRLIGTSILRIFEAGSDTPSQTILLQTNQVSQTITFGAEVPTQ